MDQWIRVLLLDSAQSCLAHLPPGPGDRYIYRRVPGVTRQEISRCVSSRISGRLLRDCCAVVRQLYTRWRRPSVRRPGTVFYPARLATISGVRQSFMVKKNKLTFPEVGYHLCSCCDNPQCFRNSSFLSRALWLHLLSNRLMLPAPFQ